jgi:hypothetical protein
VTGHDIPQERDLPTGRLTELKDELMAHIEQDLDSPPQTTPVVTTGRRWRRLGLAAAALAVFGIAASTMVGGNEPASANTAVRNADGTIIVTIREGKHPKDLERRLNDLGVPAVVDFLDSGFGCDEARSTGWVRDGRAGPLFTWDDAPDRGLDTQFVLDPSQLQPGDTAAIVFQIDEHGDELAAMASVMISTTPVGPCVPVPDGSIVDAEAGIAGG